MTKTRQPGRRRFLAYFGAAGAAATGAVLTFRPSNAQQGCAPTPSDAMGPFYVADAPVVDDLNRWGKPGEPMAVTGRVLDAGDLRTPVAQARVEAWQTDGEGRYHPQGNGPASVYADRDIDMRGTVIADTEGRFFYRTLVPGRYAPRPRHIHYRVTAPGYETLVTQHYVSDGEDVPGGPCRSGRVDRSSGEARFDGPAIYLRRA